MTHPIKDVYTFLSENEELSSLVNPDNIFILDIPIDYQKQSELPLIRINQIGEYQAEFASNMPISLSVTVQIDIWGNSVKELDPIQDKIDKIMALNGWFKYLGGLDKDPDFNDTPRIYRRYRASVPVKFD